MRFWEGPIDGHASVIADCSIDELPGEAGGHTPAFGISGGAVASLPALR